MQRREAQVESHDHGNQNLEKKIKMQCIRLYRTKVLLRISRKQPACYASFYVQKALDYRRLEMLEFVFLPNPSPAQHRAKDHLDPFPSAVPSYIQNVKGPVCGCELQGQKTKKREIPESAKTGRGSFAGYPRMPKHNAMRNVQCSAVDKTSNAFSAHLCSTLQHRDFHAVSSYNRRQPGSLHACVISINVFLDLES